MLKVQSFVGWAVPTISVALRTHLTEDFIFSPPASLETTEFTEKKYFIICREIPANHKVSAAMLYTKLLFSAVRLEVFVQSPSPDWTKEIPSLRPRRLCGEYSFAL